MLFVVRSRGPLAAGNKFGDDEAEQQLCWLGALFVGSTTLLVYDSARRTFAVDCSGVAARGSAARTRFVVARLCGSSCLGNQGDCAGTPTTLKSTILVSPRVTTLVVLNIFDGSHTAASYPYCTNERYHVECVRSLGVAAVAYVDGGNLTAGVPCLPCRLATKTKAPPRLPLWLSQIFWSDELAALGNRSPQEGEVNAEGRCAELSFFCSFFFSLESHSNNPTLHYAVHL